MHVGTDHLTRKDDPHERHRTPDFVIDVGEDGYGFLNHDKFKAGFAADASDADVAFLRDTQVPINMAVFGTPVKNAAWREKPTWAVIATDDRAFDQAMLQHMAKRIGAKVTNIKASHAVYATTEPADLVPPGRHALRGCRRRLGALRFGWTFPEQHAVRRRGRR